MFKVNRAFGPVARSVRTCRHERRRAAVIQMRSWSGVAKKLFDIQLFAGFAVVKVILKLPRTKHPVKLGTERGSIRVSGTVMHLELNAACFEFVRHRFQRCDTNPTSNQDYLLCVSREQNGFEVC